MTIEEICKHSNKHQAKKPLKTFSISRILRATSLIYLGYWVTGYITTEEGKYRYSLSWWISRLTGFLMNQTIPTNWRSWVYTTFANQYSANLDEVKEEITSFWCFKDFFTRELKEGAWVIEDANNPNTIVSPCDGKIFSYGDI